MFTWDFFAKFSDDGTIKESEGRETQVMVKENSKWKIATVHYSGLPVTGERDGF